MDKKLRGHAAIPRMSPITARFLFVARPRLALLIPKLEQIIAKIANRKPPPTNEARTEAIPRMNPATPFPF